ncbi:hypothetical protein ACJJTC_017424 [Scirpophaga incertulas]
MDLREIIRWFIPCFHILLNIFNKMDTRLTLVCLFLFFNSCPTYGAKVNSAEGVGLSKLYSHAKNIDKVNEQAFVKLNQSDVSGKGVEMDDAKVLKNFPLGRTFGRPFKKMIAGLMPLIFQVGAASTWAVVAAIVGVKTLVITLLILKLLLVVGAAKVGALFSSKHHQPDHGWQQPHKEIHLHIHNGHGAAAHEEIAPWSRTEPSNSRNDAVPETNYMVFNPYLEGPQTIRTPYGNYMKVE